MNGLRAGMATSRKALFLDRDGVINIDHGYVHLPEQTEWVPGIFDLCKLAVDQDYLLVVITNQAGIARGFYDEQAFDSYSAWMRQQFLERGVPIAAIYHCPHHPEHGIGALRTECDCRKPKPGMILRAQRELDLDLRASALIGDMPSDLEAGRAAGVTHCFRFMAHPAPGERDPMNSAMAWLRALPAGETAR